MKPVLTFLDILGAVIATKMSGDIREHFKWMLISFIIFMALACIVVRP